MAENVGSSRTRRPRRETVEEEEEVYGPTPAAVHPSIANLRGKHRAAHPDGSSILRPGSHQLMVDEWPITCPQFINLLSIAGVHCLTMINYVRLDHHLLTALVERWSPQTNTFHLAVGEMTITLQDVAMILGVRVDGPPLVGQPVVGGGRRWRNWPDCCDDLLGCHPDPDEVLADPMRPEITAKFKMGQSLSHTNVPLRWLRFKFQKNSYTDLNEIQFVRHVRAYVLFLIGCFLLPDTSKTEVHLQYLPLLENLAQFGKMSLGGAVLAHLYRELGEATHPNRVNISGCVHLLQIWSWEHLHIGRPILHVPEPDRMYGYNVGLRWSIRWIREMPTGNIMMYRDEFDGLLQSQVIWEPYTDHIRSNIDDICNDGENVWLARVPLISWKRVEWYLPDRVLRQFGCTPVIDVLPIDPSFVRVDGRGKADKDWTDYHRAYIELWEGRRLSIVPHTELTDGPNSERALKHYMRWYKSWSTLYLLKAPLDPPDTYYARASSERHFREAMLEANSVFEPFYGRDEDTDYQQAINKFENIMITCRRNTHISDTTYEDPHEDMDAGPTYAAGPSYAAPSYEGPSYAGPSDAAGPSSRVDPTIFHSYLTPTQHQQSIGISTEYQQWPDFELNWAPPQITPPTHIFFPAPAWNPMGSTSNIENADINEEPPRRMPDPDEQPEPMHNRQRRAPKRYTPGSGAIPKRRAH